MNNDMEHQTTQDVDYGDVHVIMGPDNTVNDIEHQTTQEVDYGDVHIIKEL